MAIHISLQFRCFGVKLRRVREGLGNSIVKIWKGKNGMNCLTAQSLIIKYVNDELSGNELESFLNHIDECDDCMEELKIYYILSKGMQQLDDDMVINYNFHQQFEDSLDDARHKIVKTNMNKLKKMIVVNFIIIIFPLIFTYSYNRDKYLKQPIFSTVTTSNYDLKHYFFEDKFSGLEDYLDKNDNEIDIYLTEKGVDIDKLHDPNRPTFVGK